MFRTSFSMLPPFFTSSSQLTFETGFRTFLISKRKKSISQIKFNALCTNKDLCLLSGFEFYCTIKKISSCYCESFLPLFYVESMVFYALRETSKVTTTTRIRIFRFVYFVGTLYHTKHHYSRFSWMKLKIPSMPKRFL